MLLSKKLDILIDGIDILIDGKRPRTEIMREKGRDCTFMFVVVLSSRVPPSTFHLIHPMVLQPTSLSGWEYIKFLK